MSKNTRNLSAFAKGTPSVFVVWSPFQVLCAIAALSQLQINDYLFLVYLPWGGPRNEQVTSILHKYSIEYRVLKDVTSKKARLYYKIRSLLVRKRRYSRLFIGDYKDYSELFVGCGFVSNSSDIVYLDDGNQAISLFQDKYVDDGHSYIGNAKYNLATRMLISKVRKLDFMLNFLTIYSSIPNMRFNIKRLHLEFLTYSKNNEKLNVSDIFIIGTNLKGFCEPQNITEDLFINQLDFICKRIRKQYPNDNIYYIPHGRETKSYAESICLKYNIIFRKTKHIIEVEMIETRCYPKAIYGFTSNALYTLKTLFPESYVENIVFTGDDNNATFMEYMNVSYYYEKAGIKLCKLD